MWGSPPPEFVSIFTNCSILVIIQILFCTHDPPPSPSHELCVTALTNQHVSKYSVVCTVATLLYRSQAELLVHAGVSA